MKAFINDSFIDIQQASLSVNDLAINRGYSVFDFLRTHHQIPLYIDDHLNRFQHSANLLRLKIPYSSKKIKSIILELINLNQLNNYGIRMILTGGISENNFSIGKPNFIITSSKISVPTIKDFEKGMKLITHDFKRTIASSKSTNYLMAIWLQEKIHSLKVDDVIYTSNKKVLELPRANIFMVNHQNELITPEKNILHGITRKNILKIADKLMSVKKRQISVEELSDAKEIFICSTTKRILPIIELNGKEINNKKVGSNTRNLFQALLQFENQYIKTNS